MVDPSFMHWNLWSELMPICDIETLWSNDYQIGVLSFQAVHHDYKRCIMD